MFEEEDNSEVQELEPCPRCGRTHMISFSGESYTTYELHTPLKGIKQDLFNTSSTRMLMMVCMDCGYTELYQDEMVEFHD